MHPGVWIPTFLPLFIAIVIRRAEQRLYRQLVDARAFAAESAVQLSPSRSFESSRLQGLIRQGAVRMTANSLYFLDAEGWSRHLSNRRHRVLFALSVVVALLGVAVLLLLMTR